MIIKVTEKEFEDVVNTENKILIDFYADWCGPCKALSPVLDEIAAGHNLKIGKVNVDEERNLASLFKVRSIPTMRSSGLKS